MAHFNCASWRPVQNHGGAMTANLGLVLHHAVANGSLYTQFNTPGPNAVSAHFWVSQSGQIEQYVDSTTQAWHGISLNARYCGVETEGCLNPPYADPMSDAMVSSIAAIYAEGHARHGWPFTLANQDGQAGFGYHRMAVATDCPCDIRLNRRQEILNLASGGLIPEPPLEPAPPADHPAGHPAGHPPFPGTLLVDYTAGHGTSTWQQQMAHRGWTITVDDQYGPQSAHVCRQFQTEKHLTVDGIVGPQTWDATWTAPIT